MLECVFYSTKMCAPDMADMTRGKRLYSVRFYSPSKENKGKKKCACHQVINAEQTLRATSSTVTEVSSSFPVAEDGCFKPTS